MNREEILQNYRDRKNEIEERLDEFKELRDCSEDRKFQEIAFVILTSQTEADKAWKAVEKLARNEELSGGGEEKIAETLREVDVSYPEDKAFFLVENRKNLSQPTLENPQKELKISDRIDPDDLDKTREWFVENVKGISWKGSSHFLRNIGYGNGFAIISSHIASQMYDLGLTDNPEPPNDREEYLEREKNLRELSNELGIDIKALDLVLWSMKTGEIFK